jgi:hypothetical protein
VLIAVTVALSTFISTSGSPMTVMSIDAPPFTPVLSRPDYTALMVETSPVGDTTRRAITHHGDWSRIDRMQGSAQIAEYYSAAKRVRVIISDGRSITVDRHDDWPAGIDRDARNTGDRQTHLGESCTVWSVWRTKRESPAFAHQSCVTDDGITLWERTFRGAEVVASLEATRIERRPVSAAEVTVPRALLNLDWWDVDLPALGSQSIPDHETEMRLIQEPEGSGPSRLSIRRLSPWQTSDFTMGLQRKIVITHDTRQMRFVYESDASGAPRRLSITRPDRTSYSSLPIVPSTTKFDASRSDVILGETCRWLEPSRGESSCVTRDGIALKQLIRSSETEVQTWTAVRLKRRPIWLPEIVPPSALLDPKIWGLD